MRHRSILTVLTVALLVATISAGDLYAQQEGDNPRRGRRGFGGGPGGFGGFAANPTFLLRTDAVRRELKITEDQQELINILNDELRESRPEITSDFRNLSDEDREKWNKWREEQNAQAKETLKTILDDGQYKRLEQIQLQTQGVNALLTDDVAKALSLTPEQTTKLREAQEQNSEAMRTAMREAFQGGRDGADRDAIREKMETLRKESEAKMIAHLTAEQQAQFTAMKGEPFEMPRDAFGGGRGGRGGRGPRGGPDGGEGNRPERPARPE